MSGNIYIRCTNPTVKMLESIGGIEISGVVSSVEISKVESRATLLTLLDLVLHEHRKKFGTPYNQLNGKKALVHLILMKHHWMPKQINERNGKRLNLMNFFFQFRMNSHLIKNKRNRPEIFRLSRLEITNSSL